MTKMNATLNTAAGHHPFSPFSSVYSVDWNSAGGIGEGGFCEVDMSEYIYIGQRDDIHYLVITYGTNTAHVQRVTNAPSVGAFPGGYEINSAHEHILLPQGLSDKEIQQYCIEVMEDPDWYFKQQRYLHFRCSASGELKYNTIAMVEERKCRIRNNCGHVPTEND